MDKPILIQGAMQIETEYLVNQLCDFKKISINGYDFYKGIINDKYVVISTTKIGSINSAVAAILGIREFNPKIVINQGVAGGHSTDVHVGDIILGENVINMNSYITDELEEYEGIHPENWKLISFKTDNNMNLEKLIADSNLVSKFKKVLEQELNKKIHVGTIISGDAWNQEVDRIKWFINIVDSKCEDMESYPAYKVCTDNNIPIIGIRIISNSVLNKEPYDRNLATKLQTTIINSLNNITF